MWCSSLHRQWVGTRDTLLGWTSPVHEIHWLKDPKIILRKKMLVLGVHLCQSPVWSAVGWNVSLQRSLVGKQQYACVTVWKCHSLCGVLHLGQTMASFCIPSLLRPARSPWHPLPCHTLPPVRPGFALVLAVGTAGCRCWPHPGPRLACWAWLLCGTDGNILACSKL